MFYNKKKLLYIKYIQRVRRDARASGGRYKLNIVYYIVLRNNDDSFSKVLFYTTPRELQRHYLNVHVTL